MAKKILVISYVALMNTTPNGRTMKSLLQGVSPDDVSLFCCVGTPDAGSCASAYKVTNREALFSLLRPSKAGRVLKKTEEGTAASLETRRGAKKAWKYLAKELIWLSGRWYNRRFEKWLDEQRPDCILYMYGDHIGLQKMAVNISRKRNIPLYVYSCEDYCFKNYNYIDQKRRSATFAIFQALLQKWTKRLFAQTSGLITNSDALGRDYAKAYSLKNVTTVMMASQMAHVPNDAVKDIMEIHVDFLGAIGAYRAQALIDIGEALQEIDRRLKLHVYGRVEDSLRGQLESCKGIEYKGFVSYEEVQEVMRSSALVVEAINNEPYVCQDKKYGFSTKYADCFACGTPFLVYVPKDIIESQFALEHTCAFVATKKEELTEVLKRALFDEAARKTQVERALVVTNLFFNREKNEQRVKEMLEL